MVDGEGALHEFTVETGDVANGNANDFHYQSLSHASLAVVQRQHRRAGRCPVRRAVRRVDAHRPHRFEHQSELVVDEVRHVLQVRIVAASAPAGAAPGVAAGVSPAAGVDCALAAVAKMQAQ